MSFISIGNTAQGDTRRLVAGQSVVDANGNCTIEIPPSSVAMFRTGSVTVYDSPLGILWTARLNGIAFDIATGPTSLSGIQIGPNDTLTLSASGLSVYTGQTLHATMTAVESPAENTNLIIPGHDSLLLGNSSGGLITTQTISAGPTSILAVPIPLGISHVLVQITSIGGNQVCNFWWNIGQSGSGLSIDDIAFAKQIGFSTTTLGFLTVLGNVLYFNAVGSGTVQIIVIGCTTQPTIPPQHVISVQGVTVPVGFTSYYPALCTPGRYKVWANLGINAGYYVRLERWNGSAWLIVSQVQDAGTGDLPNSPVEFLMSWDDWRITLNNASAGSDTAYVGVIGPF